MSRNVEKVTSPAPPRATHPPGFLAEIGIVREGLPPKWRLEPSSRTPGLATLTIPDAGPLPYMAGSHEWRVLVGRSTGQDPFLRRAA